MRRYRYCFVPNCVSAENCNEKVSVFGAPRDPELFQDWVAALPPTKKELTLKDAVCAKHFKEEDIISSWNSGGITFPFLKSRLSKTAVPCIFPKASASKRSLKTRRKVVKYSAKYSAEFVSQFSEPKTKRPKVIKQDIEELNLHTELDIPIKEEFDSYSPKSKTKCPKEINQELEEVSLHTEFHIPVKEEFVSLFDSIYNREVSISLPDESWAIHYVNKKYICISQTVVREECPITLRQILIMEDLTLKFFIREKSISNIDKFIDLTNPITNNNLEAIICQFQNVNVCLGGPTEILYPQFMINTTIASVDRSSNNWRHNKCSLIYVGNKLSCLNCFRLHSIFAKQSNL